MPGNIYRGGTKKYGIALYDETDTQFSCEDVYNIEVRLIHQTTKAIYEKYSMLVQAGWVHVEVVDEELIIPINAAITTLMDTGMLEIEVTVYQTDTDFTNSKSIERSKATLAYVKDI
jgi:hypothetical protein